ncbi:MAG: hypothetical protein U0694_01205 [Anaerolineae bacterium]
MGIKIAWDNQDQTTIRFDFDGKWNFLDVDYAVNESINLMKRVSHQVDWLINLENSGPLAAGAVLESRELREPIPANHGWVGFAGDEMFARGIAGILSRVYPILGEEFLFGRDLGYARAAIGMAPARVQSEPNASE